MIFSEKALRASLVLGSALVAAILWIFALSAYFQILPLTKHALAHVDKWQIEKIHSERFQLRAIYSFETASRVYRGETLLFGRYRNETSAIRGLQRLAKEPQRVWYDPLRPSRSSLEKRFPWNYLIRAILSSMVCFYFSFVYFRKYFKLDNLSGKGDN